MLICGLGASRSPLLLPLAIRKLNPAQIELTYPCWGNIHYVFLFFLMPLFLAKHGLFFCDYAAAYATFRWLCFRLCSIFRGHICPKKAIMLLHMLLGAYAIYYALILGSNTLSRGDCATTAVLLYDRFRLIYSGFWW